jgi:hypothetical protein
MEKPDNASDVIATVYHEPQNRPWDNASDVVTQSFDGASTHNEEQWDIISQEIHYAMVRERQHPPEVMLVESDEEDEPVMLVESDEEDEPVILVESDEEDEPDPDPTGGIAHIDHERSTRLPRHIARNFPRNGMVRMLWRA